MPQVPWLMVEWGIPDEGPTHGSTYTSPEMFLERSLAVTSLDLACLLSASHPSALGTVGWVSFSGSL